MDRQEAHPVLWHMRVVLPTTMTRITDESIVAKSLQLGNEAFVEELLVNGLKSSLSRSQRSKHKGDEVYFKSVKTLEMMFCTKRNV
jgi:hypothetical protein